MIVVGEQFEIIVNRWQDTRKFKMQVHCVHVSEQVLRFKISAGNKEMMMEKLLMKKRPPMEDHSYEFPV